MVRFKTVVETGKLRLRPRGMARHIFVEVRIETRSALVSLPFVLRSLPAQAQVSFLQPPMFAGTCNVFVADFNRDGKFAQVRRPPP